jgi:dTDP-4-amino-4,6-dideoxygalactose transaminase
LKIGEANYSYFPIIFNNEDQLIRVEKALNEEKIFPRRYFYPAVNTFEAIVKYDPMPNAEDIAKRILCLPLYWKLKSNEIDQIVNIIRNQC